MGETHILRVAQPLQKRPNLGGKRPTITKVIHKPKRGGNWEGSANSQGWPSRRNLGNCSQSGKRYRISAFHCNKWFVHEQCRWNLSLRCWRRNRSSFAWKSLRTCLTVQTTTQTSWRPSSLVMRHGFMAMTQKLSSSPPNERNFVLPNPQKARQVHSNVKTLLTCFFGSSGTVHHEYASQGQRINKQYYLEVQRCLQEAVCRKRPYTWEAMNWQLDHDNAPTHSTHILVIQAFLIKNTIPFVRQTPYSPDLAPCDLWLFPKLKTMLKGGDLRKLREKRWQSSITSQRVIQRGYQQLQNCREKRVNCQGKYREFSVIHGTTLLKVPCKRRIA